MPFGYSAKDKKLLVNEAEAHVVREAFALFLAHRQMAIVARELNRRGLLPRASKHGRTGGPLWTKDGIARVLRSPLYAGRMMYGDELYDGEHPQLIDDVTYRQAQRLLGLAGRELRVTGTNPEYVLRGLLRCGGCGEAMCPGSTTKNSGKPYRFYRCSTRDKYGTDRCSARPLPACSLEDFVVARLTEAAADGTLAERVQTKLAARVAKERSTFLEVRKALSAQIADASAATSRLTEEVVRLDGRARELVEAKLRAEAARLDDAERRLGALEDDAVNLELVESQQEWFVGALRNFGRVWGDMTPENQGRLMRALVAKVSVDEGTGVCRVELVNSTPSRARRRPRDRRREQRGEREEEHGCRRRRLPRHREAALPPQEPERHARRDAAAREARARARPAKVAQQLALAHHLHAAIDRGAVADRADVARKLGLTRARVTQLLDLLLLAPDLQDAVLALEAVDGAEPMAERRLRAVAHAGTWAEQRAVWQQIGRLALTERTLPFRHCAEVPFAVPWNPLETDTIPSRERPLDERRDTHGSRGRGLAQGRGQDRVHDGAAGGAASLQGPRTVALPPRGPRRLDRAANAQQFRQGEPG